MKTIYGGSASNEVKIKVKDNYCILFVSDEEDCSAEICIPIEDARHIAYRILGETE